MRYEIMMLLKRLCMRFSKRDCDTCRHYDGKFGDDCYFECEHSIKAIGYERRGT